MPNISTRQKSLLHVAKAKLGLSDEDYRAILFSAAGVESSKDLDTAGFERVLERFVQLGFDVQLNQPKCRARSRDAAAMVTPAQLAKLESLYTELGWEKYRQIGFNRRVCGRPWPQDRAEANKVIEALKKMTARGYGRDEQIRR